MNESGFLTEPGISGVVSRLELLHSSDAGFSEIWRADKYGHFVVLKCLKKEFRGDSVYETLLRKEFDIAYGLNHPSICRVWNYYNHPSLGNCIEMEWVDGMNLNYFLEKGKPNEKLFRKIAVELCEALSYIHSRQIIHRDISPGNIMFTHNGTNVKLIDFGLADSDSSSVLKMQAGTKDYMAPEVLAGGVADIRSDIYSAGKVLSALSSGHKRSLRKACAKDPRDRYQFAHDFEKDIVRKSATGLYIATAFVAIIAGIVLYNVRDAGSTPRIPDATETSLPENSPSEQSEERVTAPAKDTKQAKQNATREELDALLNQAEDLFR